MRLPRFAVRSRTLLVVMAVVVLAAAAAVAYLLWQDQPEGRIPLRSLSDDATATVGFAGAFPAEEAEALANPIGTAWDGEVLYVAESDGGRIRRFDQQGGDLGNIVLVPAEGQTSVYPSSIAVAAQGELVVVDNAGARVVVVGSGEAAEANVRLTLGGRQGAVQPTSVTHADGEYFVFDAAVSAVLVYDSDGALKRTIGSELDPKVAFAPGMCVVDGTLFIADSNAGRVVAIDADTGTQEFVFPDRYSLPRAVIPLERGYVAVVDAFGQSVYVTTTAGERADVIDAETAPEGALASPRDAAWVTETQRLYVTDAVSGAVAVYNVRLGR